MTVFGTTSDDGEEDIYVESSFYSEEGITTGNGGDVFYFSLNMANDITNIESIGDNSIYAHVPININTILDTVKK